MREIKFRGRDTDGNWHYGDLLRYVRDSYDMIIPVGNANSDDLYDDAICVDSATVGQFTGLKDCKGQEIYEGDVLRDPDGKTLKVVWNNGAGSWECAREDYHLPRVLMPTTKRRRENAQCVFIMRYIDVMTVIGNIYDNPELLEATEGGRP